jgi:hypothetical protein
VVGFDPLAGDRAVNAGRVGDGESAWRNAIRASSAPFGRPWLLVLQSEDDQTTVRATYKGGV